MAMRMGMTRRVLKNDGSRSIFFTLREYSTRKLYLARKGYDTPLILAQTNERLIPYHGVLTKSGSSWERTILLSLRAVLVDCRRS